MMYDELIKRLREAAEYIPCIMDREDAIKAADAIEELQAQIDGWIEQERNALLKSIPKWIPVTERLPEKYIGEWLCCTDDGQILILPYDTPGDGSKECVFYAWDDAGCFSQTFKVTHWMPLPKPPKEE